MWNIVFAPNYISNVKLKIKFPNTSIPKSFRYDLYVLRLDVFRSSSPEFTHRHTFTDTHTHTHTYTDTHRHTDTQSQIFTDSRKLLTCAQKNHKRVFMAAFLNKKHRNK